MWKQQLFTPTHKWITLLLFSPAGTPPCPNSRDYIVKKYSKQRTVDRNLPASDNPPCAICHLPASRHSHGRCTLACSLWWFELTQTCEQSGRYYRYTFTMADFEPAPVTVLDREITLKKVPSSLFPLFFLSLLSFWSVLGALIHSINRSASATPHPLVLQHHHSIWSGPWCSCLLAARLWPFHHAPLSQRVRSSF
jgi:hypothetical protein